MPVVRPAKPRSNDVAERRGTRSRKLALTRQDADRERAARSTSRRTSTIGRFELIREIARGGMGQVFLARDTKLGRKVAIKFLLHDDPDFVQRFLVEARATARCTHENIVTIYEVGEHEGLPYMVLEYLEGKTLSRGARDQAVDAAVHRADGAGRARARARARARHRPPRSQADNIFVTDRGQVKVLDFGVARI